MNLGSKKLMALLSLIAIALSTYVIITTLPNNAIKYVEASDPGSNEAPPPPPQQQQQQPTQQPVGSSNEGNQQPPPPPPQGSSSGGTKPQPPSTSQSNNQPKPKEPKVGSAPNNKPPKPKEPKGPKEKVKGPKPPNEENTVPPEVLDTYRLLKYFSSNDFKLVGDKASVLNDLVSTAKVLYMKSLYYLKKGEVELARTYARVALEALHQAEHLTHQGPLKPPAPPSVLKNEAPPQHPPKPRPPQPPKPPSNEVPQPHQQPPPKP